MNDLICGDNIEILKGLESNSIDLTVTSPPYDGLRDYNGYSFDFEGVVEQLYRVTKEGGIIVWVVKDSVIEGSESGTSFRQALHFKEIGFNLHDTMIYQNDPRFPEKWRYRQSFEYMFILSKGKPKTFNSIKDIPTKNYGRKITSNNRSKNGELDGTKETKLYEYHDRGNIWFIKNGYMKSSKDKIAYQHPAIFPEALARDHIISWSNEGDIVLDPFVGSGTTCKMAKQLNRNYIGIDISQEYIDIVKERIR